VAVFFSLILRKSGFHDLLRVRLVHSTRTYVPMKMEQRVPKRRHINFRRRRITQKKAYNKRDGDTQSR